MKGTLTYRVKDLCQAALDKEVQVIAHQANCFSTMKSGVAKRISEVFPEAVKADKDSTLNPYGRLGKHTAAIGKAGVLVYNLYGQYNYGSDGKQYTRYRELGKSLYHMQRDLPLSLKTPIGLPKLGCGLAGGEWIEVKRLIEKHLCNKGHDVIIYILDKNEIPKEDRL